MILSLIFKRSLKHYNALFSSVNIYQPDCLLSGKMYHFPYISTITKVYLMAILFDLCNWPLNLINIIYLCSLSLIDCWTRSLLPVVRSVIQSRGGHPPAGRPARQRSSGNDLYGGPVLLFFLFTLLKLITFSLPFKLFCPLQIFFLFSL